MNNTDCSACKERIKNWQGDDPTCGFMKGTFSSVNWNCATLNKLRDIAKEREVTWADDQHVALIYVNDITDGEFMWLWVGWYKSRGRTEGVLLIDQNGFSAIPSLSAIEKIVKELEE